MPTTILSFSPDAVQLLVPDDSAPDLYWRVTLSGTGLVLDSETGALIGGIVHSVTMTAYQVVDGLAQPTGTTQTYGSIDMELSALPGWDGTAWWPDMSALKALPGLHPGVTQDYDMDGNRVIFGGTGDDNMIGGAGHDMLYGMGGADTLLGQEGDDVIEVLGPVFEVPRVMGSLAFGGEGNDLLIGASGDDSLRGGDGADTIFGEGGNDSIRGGDGGAQVWGGEGDDSALGGTGDDLFHGEAGHDVLQGWSGADSLYGQDGDDHLYGGDDADLLMGGAGHDYMMGGSGDDWLDMGDGDDRAEGEDGADTLIAGAGNDTLSGDAGDDWLVAGDGLDILNGGAGADVFVIGAPGGPAAGARASVLDFENGIDRIHLDLGEVMTADEVFAAFLADLRVDRRGLTYTDPDGWQFRLWKGDLAELDASDFIAITDPGGLPF